MYTGNSFWARLILGLRSIVPTNGSKCVGTPIKGYSMYVSPNFDFNCTYKWLKRSLFGNWNIDRRPHIHPRLLHMECCSGPRQRLCNLDPLVTVWSYSVHVYTKVSPTIYCTTVCILYFQHNGMETLVIVVSPHRIYVCVRRRGVVLNTYALIVIRFLACRYCVITPQCQWLYWYGWLVDSHGIWRGRLSIFQLPKSDRSSHL